MEAALESDHFVNILDKYDAFINGDKKSITKSDSNEDYYQGLTYSPELCEVIDNSYEEKPE